MNNAVLLNNIDHKDLRVITTRGAAYGDDVKFALTFPAEFRNVQAHYPIVFHKTADGKFQSIALFGFQDKENLFLGPDGWDAQYVPLTVERQPFLIGFRDREPMVHIDLASPRVSRTEGEALFREYGGSSDFLERMSSVLLTIHQGLEAVPAFIDALASARLAGIVRARRRAQRPVAASSHGLLHDQRGASWHARRGRSSNECTRQVICRRSTWRSLRCLTSAI